MPVPLLPIALGGGVLALLLLSRRQIPISNVVNRPVDPRPITPNQRGNRTLPRPLPPGTIGVARVVPNSFNGLLLRRTPGTQASGSALGPDGTNTLIAPSGDLRHAFNGDEVAVLERGVRASNNRGPEEWWRVHTAGGGVGYARAIDPEGVSNFTDFQEAGGGGGGGERPIVTAGWPPYGAMGVDPFWAARVGQVNALRALRNAGVDLNANSLRQVSQRHPLSGRRFPRPLSSGVVIARAIADEGRGGVDVRTEADTEGLHWTLRGLARVGDEVMVLQRGIASASLTPGAEEWWYVRTIDGREGFARAVAPSGTPSLQLVRTDAGVIN